MTTNNQSLENDPSKVYGKFLAQPPPGEEVVISGMSGQFPLSSNIEEFKDNLYNKVNMVSYNEKVVHPEIPPGRGKLKDGEFSRFDAGFFGVHKLQALTMSPMLKILLEKCVECIFDAGLHPADLEGTRTGVFLGICFSETEEHWYIKHHVKNGNAICGNMKSALVNRISYFLKLNALSCTLDTACSSTLYTLDAAYRAIREGKIEQAIVCGCNTVSAVGTTLQFARLGVLSKEGILRAFDDAGTGYVRAEAISAILVQKVKNCNRVYATVLHVKTNCDGYKEEGITYPGGESQLSLMQEVYLESGINPNDVSFIEAHGTGTPVGDPVELKCIEEFFVKERAVPLLIGSVKSSMGHSEATAGLCSIVKAIFAFETSVISPNINFSRPIKSISGLCDGRIKVVVEKTPFQDQNGIIGVNSFGFGGANAHVILKWNTKKKTGNGKPLDNLSRLICLSGRTEEAVNCLLLDVANKFDTEYIGLIHNSFRKPISNHLFRGYIIASKLGVIKQSVKPFNLNKSKLHIYFGGLLGIPVSLAQELLSLSIFSDFKRRTELLLIRKRLNLYEILSNSVTSNLNLLLAELITQLCIAELLIQLEIDFNGSSGDFFGKLICGYFENALSLEEVLECIYVVGLVVNDSNDDINGSKKGNCKYTEIIAENKIRILKQFKEILQSKQYNNGTEMRTKSPEFFVDALCQNIQNDSGNITTNSVILQIGQGLTAFRNKRFNVLNFDYNGGFHGVLEVLGSLYEYGIHPQVQKLYPKVHFPVSRGTPMISSKIKWKHDYVHFVPTIEILQRNIGATRFPIRLGLKEWKYLDGHIIDEGDEPVVTGRIKVLGDHQQLDLTTESDEPLRNNDLFSYKDIYKELRLRGYNYKGLFKSLSQFNGTTTSAKIQWANNWIAFMDNMLQLKILTEDTRLLYVPVSIARLAINPKAHLDKVNSLKTGDDSEMVNVSVEYNSNTDIIRSGGIEIRGLLASSIPRKKITALPVLEKYQFVPNEVQLPLEQSVRVFMQVALENNCGLKVSVAELMYDDSKSNIKPIGPIIQDVLEDQPLVQSNITILSKENLDLELKAENKNPESNFGYTVIVGCDLLTRKEMLEVAMKATGDLGYIISREPLNTNPKVPVSNLITVNISKTDQETLVFLKKHSKNIRPTVYVNITNEDKTFGWLNELRNAVSKDCNVIVWCQNEPLNGVVGLVNCIRREPGCQKVRCLFIVDEAPDFDPSNPFYKKQLDKNMAVNVYMNSQWGTYRHFLLENIQEVENEHCYVNSTIRGDLSSIKWIEGPLSSNTRLEENQSLVEVYYSSLNFRDVMTASGRITVDVITRDRREQECVLGFEFSGKTKSGQRVMGLVTQGALATLVKANTHLMWEVPYNWSLKDAATVPAVYGTCLYALVVVGKIKPSDSILIHSGTGGIGQAAINLCLNMGCTVFTTVGTKEKKEFILKNYPQISERHIGNSRDLSFEQMIMRETDGKGVDIVLNSLAEEKLVASAKCLAAEGRFLEIGKFDLANNHQLNLLPFTRGASYHGVMLDQLFKESSHIQEKLNNLLQKYLDSGAVKPLVTTVFEKNQVEEAFRFMAAGKHIGKVLVEIRKEDEMVLDRGDRFKGLARYFCDPEKCYIICGGLGGFGLELADWLVLRGAKNLVLTSRKGITTGYQSYRISIWKNYLCNIKISTQDITSRSGCVELINEANSLAPIDAIFNLAVVLDDAILENQSEKSFKTSFGPKAIATEYLDEVSRKMCPELKNFVVFSSVSCGRGNAGQSNYGMSNSVMERICEKRQKDGYPALAIQWGAVGDVGLVAELQEDHIELEIGGTLQQSISNCLQVMDVLVRQSEATIVSSMVVAEKRTASTDKIEEVIALILGIRDLKSVSMHSTLAELGMDSMSAIEVKQTLEREYNIFLSPAELRTLTLARIQELQETSSPEKGIMEQNPDDVFNLVDILSSIKHEKMDSPLLRLRTRTINKSVMNLPKIIALPGIEGYCDVLEHLTQNLEVDAYGLNYCTFMQTNAVSHMADMLLPYVKELEPEKSFYLLAHSVGSVVALELVSKLEKLGYMGTLTLLDGSPSFASKMTKDILLKDGDFSESGLENLLLAGTLGLKLNTIELEAVMNDIYKCTSLQEKLKIGSAKLNLQEEFSEKMVFDSASATIKRFKACSTYTPTFQKLKSKLRLFKPTILSVSMDSEDYDLNQYCEQSVDIKVFEGTHTSFLENPDMAKAIMEHLEAVRADK